MLIKSCLAVLAAAGQHATFNGIQDHVMMGLMMVISFIQLADSERIPGAYPKRPFSSTLIETVKYAPPPPKKKKEG